MNNVWLSEEYVINWTNLPKLLNFVKNVGLLKFNNGNIIIAKITGTVLYKSQTLLNIDSSDTCRTYVLLNGISSLGHMTFEMEVISFAVEVISYVVFVSESKIRYII